MAVAMVSAECCLDNGKCAKMCFTVILKPQNVKNVWWPFCLHKDKGKNTVKPLITEITGFCDLKFGHFLDVGSMWYYDGYICYRP